MNVFSNLYSVYEAKPTGNIDLDRQEAARYDCVLEWEFQC
jgi:hypothetical protein